MPLRFLTDENFDGRITDGLLSRTAIDVVRVQDVGLYSESDPEILNWSAEANRILLSHDIRTIPKYAVERVRSGMTMPGVVLVPDSMPIGQAISDIQLLSECSSEEELEWQVVYLPL